jgi:hypothetical protein
MVKVHKDQKSPFISNLKKPEFASKRDVLELATLRYVVVSYTALAAQSAFQRPVVPHSTQV